MLSLEVLIATYNRSNLLGGCLESFFAAAPPDRLDWRVTVVDNNSKDATREVAEAFVAKFPAKVRYLFEPRPGKSAALNLGIRETDRSLTAMIDDDERIDATWLGVVEDCFRDPDLDFLGGPYIGLWETTRPEWLPPGYDGVLSADDASSLPSARRSFEDDSFFLRGGNAVIKRALFDRVGLYAEDLGRFADGLGSCEDQDMLERLKAAGSRGLFAPDLIVHHLVPPERVTRAYFRKWVWDRALSLAQMDRRRRQSVAYLGRLPRYLVRKTLLTAPDLISGSPATRFAAELQWRNIIGYAWGAYFGTIGR